ncbi:hypothetical protein EYF80_036413 [Liparis tanakae]|uniref:Uncharacterized protein n=1 Tax=Liparis tanakae TaxID=230148 RepID=A0A4Z2GIR8_9TELE|nr:hypothetical protein EYF80_036413 [Liparis tanakae]
MAATCFLVEAGSRTAPRGDHTLQKKKREKEKKEKRSLFLPTVTAELTRGPPAGRRTVDSGSEGTPGSLLRPDGRPSRRVWPIGEEVKGRLLAEPPPLNL